MEINDRLKISEIQDAFSKKYPMLKLEFYSEKHEEGKGSKDEYRLDPEKTLGEVRKTHTEGNLSIEPDLKVGELEAAFENNYGLHVQVFRSSGSVYLQTTATDDWTLEQQNSKGTKD